MDHTPQQQPGEGQTKVSVNFDRIQSAHHSTVGNGLGYDAKMEVDTSSEGCGCGMINSRQGMFKLRKVRAMPRENSLRGIGSSGLLMGPLSAVRDGEMANRVLGCEGTEEGWGGSWDRCW